MREMKNSGVEWIGDIPADWKILKIKNIAKRSVEKNHSDKQVLSLYRELGIVIKSERNDNHNVTSENTYNYNFVEQNDIVVNKMKAWQGSIAVSNYEGIVSPAYYVYKIISKGIFPRYIHYILRCSAYLPEYRRLSGGIRIGQWDLSDENFKNIPFVLPSFDEQHRIADYLDEKCAKIDAVIEKQKQVIEKLKEYKLSVITEEVTKGLDPTVPMKDSGVEWIGEIPEGWKITKIKNLCKLKTGTTPSTSNLEWFDGDLHWFTPGDFKDDFILRDSQRKLSNKAKEDGVAVITPENTTLIVGIGATAGKIGYATVESSFNQQITAIYSDKVFSKYLMYWMIANTKFLRETALFTTLPILNNQTIGGYLLVFPKDYSEQMLIAETLDKKCSEIDLVIAKKQSIVEKLTEYKKSLIYEVVTGKREV